MSGRRDVVESLKGSAKSRDGEDSEDVGSKEREC